MIETLRSYLNLAAGLVESTAERAKESASQLVSRSAEGPEMMSEHVQEIAEDLIEQSRTNRELMIGLIRTEIDRAVGRMGFVREEELAAVRKHVERLESQLNQRGDQASAAASLAVSTASADTAEGRRLTVRVTWESPVGSREISLDRVVPRDPDLWVP